MKGAIKITAIISVILITSCKSTMGDNNGMINGSLAELPNENTENETVEVNSMNTEIATVQDVKDDIIILQNSAGELYYIYDASQFDLPINKDQVLVFSYTEKKLSEEGYYILTVSWLDDWKKFNQNYFTNGV